MTRGWGWPSPTHDTACGAPHASCSSAGWVPSGCFAGTAKRSPGKQIRSRARLKSLKLVVPRACCASSPALLSPAFLLPQITQRGRAVPALPSSEGPGRAHCRQKRHRNGQWELAPGTGTGIPAARVGTLSREGWGSWLRGNGNTGQGWMRTPSNEGWEPWAEWDPGQGGMETLSKAHGVPSWGWCFGGFWMMWDVCSGQGD